MKSGQNDGYTIIEVLIFIAVSASLFVSAMVAIGGRQQQVQFTQAVRGFDSQLKDLMNDVSTGFFPGLGTVNCRMDPSASANVRPELNTQNVDESIQQGTSDNCIFVGKALQFGPSIGDTTENSRILVHTLVGRRTNADQNDVTGIAEANPVAVSPLSESDPLPNFTNEIILDWGLRVNRVVVPGGGGGTFGSIGLFNTFSSTQSSDPISESQVVDLGPITTSEIGQTSYDAVALLNTITDSAPIPGEVEVSLNPPEGVVLCLSDPDQNREAAITLSSSNRRLSSTITFDQVDEAICG
jgi:type II secretory pathway pseudopilin PulG